MILEEFALNPEAIKEWKDLNTITMNFGFHNGAVISSFPKNWLATLKQKAEIELNGKTEYLRVIEKLRIIKEGVLIKSGREFMPEHNWIKNSIMQHEQIPFYKIIHVDRLAGHAEVIRFDDIDELLFIHLRQGKIKRYAQSIAEVSRLLLVNSKNIQLIDPYFSATNKGFVKPLRAMLKIVGQNITSIQFHTSYFKSKTEVCINSEKKALDEYYKSSIPAGQQIEFFWWDDGKTGEIHPRYLVTEKGGICFDRGFVEPSPIEQRDAETLVLMLTPTVTTSILLEYGEFSSKYKLVYNLNPASPKNQALIPAF